MGSVHAELSLDLKPTFLPKTITDFLYEVSTIGNAAEKRLRLDDYVERLEEEMRKIDAFKRELPLCMLIMNDAILVLKDESAKWRIPNSQSILEEFIPLKKECDQKEEIKKEKENRDKKNWMSSVQLWNTPSVYEKKNWMSSVQLWNTAIYPTTANNNFEQKQHLKVENKKMKEEGKSAAEDSYQPSINRSTNGCRAFMPFTYPAVPVAMIKEEKAAKIKEEKEESVINGLSLSTPGIKKTNTRESAGASGSITSSNSAVSSSPSPPSAQANLHPGPQQSSRKQRRCWSPELHRRFVNALQQLGGSQATPKQIRELMHVDGLTNDEVKSHLQKYRLHTRRIHPAISTPANQSSAVLGDLWMSQDQYSDSTKTTGFQSASPEGPLQLARSARGSSPPEDKSIRGRSFTTT
ncbi:hypothetical protein L6164_031987 [Bauhinia variegata]|uniref:Uncharacterized protein n=1 Tax=Bauhinia variegata TaxID=167791 RepID=A0ACB9KMD2_BAUVA|nr:hypothetical protein L6164_031987 [Bauhinia variegata]